MPRNLRQRIEDGRLGDAARADLRLDHLLATVAEDFLGDPRAAVGSVAVAGPVAGPIPRSALPGSVGAAAAAVAAAPSGAAVRGTASIADPDTVDPGRHQWFIARRS